VLWGLVVPLLVAAQPTRAQDRCTAAQEASPVESLEALEAMDLESLLNTRVYSSTKQSQRGAATPAVVTVVTGEEIRARGYNSLAEVLRTVPGFYGVHDLVGHNVGVRGVNGGPRAGGNVIKVMIDNHPVDYRPTTENFLGEELIPMEVVDRVEVIRGPASALYGANAFLGVVNVITRCGSGPPGLQAVGHGVLTRGRPGGGAGLVMGASMPGVSGLVAGKAMAVDRDGLRVPGSSPLLRRPGSAAGNLGQESSGDWSRPRTFFGKATVATAAGSFTGSASIQNQEAGGEFLGARALTHGTTVALLNQNYRLLYEKQFGDILGTTVSANYLLASPMANDRLDTGRDDYVVVRKEGVRGWGFSAEGRLALGESHSVTVGSDFQNEDHTLPAFASLYVSDVKAPDGTVTTRSGTLVPGEGWGATKRLQNLGAYAQGLVSFSNGWGAVLGARTDYQNIYGANLSVRGGFVYAPEDRNLSFKLLYGTSYKAPSASQLYATPQGPGDFQGNPRLGTQSARTVEAAWAAGFPGDRGEIAVNLFATNVTGRVEFVQRGLFQTAENTVTELVLGGEVATRVVVSRPFHVRFLAGAARTAWQKAATGTAVESVSNQLFPALQFHLIGQYDVEAVGAHATVEGSYIGSRTSSQSNALLNGKEYALPGYLYTSASLTWAREVFGSNETRVGLRVNNVLNNRYADPGAGGVDVPAQGVQGVLTVSQSL
jgi:iron complex outermembrane receptor protein